MYIYNLAGWEVCIVKNCDRGLEKPIFKPEVIVLRLSSRGYCPKPDNDLFIFFRRAYKWVCLRNIVIELAYAPSTNHSYLKKF